jgi:hypothetical protein
MNNSQKINKQNIKRRKYQNQMSIRGMKISHQNRIKK